MYKIVVSENSLYYVIITNYIYNLSSTHTNRQLKRTDRTSHNYITKKNT
jgi:hypothetical protein